MAKLQRPIFGVPFLQISPHSVALVSFVDGRSVRGACSVHDGVTNCMALLVNSEVLYLREEKRFGVPFGCCKYGPHLE